MNNNRNNDFGERLESLGSQVAKPVKKAAEIIAKDVVEQFVPLPLPSEQKEEIKNEDKQKAMQIRQNINKINQEILEIRKKKEQEMGKAKQQDQNKKQDKKVEEKKKESVLAKLLKSRRGTKESMQRASG